MKPSRSLHALLLSATAVGCGAADFVNLRFEEPDLSGSLTPLYEGGPLVGNTDQILKGWTLLVNGVTPPTMTYAPIGTSSAGNVTLKHYPPELSTPEFGSHQLILQSTLFTGPELRLKQTGTIPLDAATLGLFANGFVEVRINGELIGVANTTTFRPEFDVSRFAGQTVELDFNFGKGQQLGFDIFGFAPVPEPSTWALLGIGLGALLWAVRRK